MSLIQSHLPAGRGFPAAAGMPFVLLEPGERLDVPKEWITHYKDHSQIKPLFIKGVHGGIEFVGQHEQVLLQLYPKDLPSKEERLAQANVELAQKIERERAAQRTSG